MSTAQGAPPLHAAPMPMPARPGAWGRRRSPGPAAQAALCRPPPSGPLAPTAEAARLRAALRRPAPPPPARRSPHRPQPLPGLADSAAMSISAQLEVAGAAPLLALAAFTEQRPGAAALGAWFRPVASRLLRGVRCPLGLRLGRQAGVLRPRGGTGAEGGRGAVQRSPLCAAASHASSLCALPPPLPSHPPWSNPSAHPLSLPLAADTLRHRQVQGADRAALALAPQGVVTHVHPLGPNEAARARDLLREGGGQGGRADGQEPCPQGLPACRCR